MSKASCRPWWAVYSVATGCCACKAWTAGRNQVDALGMAEAAAVSTINFGSHGDSVKSQSNQTRVRVGLTGCTYQKPLAC